VPYALDIGSYENLLGVEVEVYCLAGLDSRFCTRRFEENLDKPSSIVDIVDQAITQGKIVLLVSTALSGFEKVLAEVEDLGRNPFLLEATGIPEAMLSGLSLDSVISFHLGLITLTVGERRRARKVYPPVTRRQLLRNLFIVKPYYAIQPKEIPGKKCGSCPYNAIRDDGFLDAGRCRGCMLCLTRCGLAPIWTGPAALAYTYKFVEEAMLDGVVFICRSQLGLLDSKAVEASPARLIAFHVPCISWLNPQLLRALESLDVYTTVLYDSGLCKDCKLSKAAEIAVSMLREEGIEVSDSLTPASMHAFEGYSRPKRSGDEVASVLASAAKREGLRSASH
jgi:Pyruvate/2-oxoacid:ferredoxin oxidoreductase delta subunit